ncbi:hypothetical protein CSIM01_04946 [Colletotrichum simmondsii]|uniref:Uncharacterized protein n=1 Tax=Colletotrichum simmondsii TaxID=703756 RepID=A0A135SKM2_9PEZI|nr:hypothetical protein CSIM01_04946 [Colletotrichum simmondsii]
MGASISIAQCKSHYNTTVDCSVTPNESGGFRTIAGYERREVPPEPDIAGIGIVSVFIAVASFAFAIGVFDVMWTVVKHNSRKHQRRPLSRIKTSGFQRPRWASKFSRSKFFQALVVSCSDQQVFTGGAYLVTIRFWKGCSITAYHYNIVANMLLLSCATHLMSVVISKNYFERLLLACLRVFFITAVFAMTGLLLSNQNASNDLPFPTKVPPSNETDSLLFYHAVCFQNGEDGVEQLKHLLLDSVRNGTAAEKALLYSTPGNYIQGWNFYLVILVWKRSREAVDNSGWRKRDNCFVRFVSSVGRVSYGVYLVGGIGICGTTVVMSSLYIMNLRRWVKRSQWLEVEDGGQSTEDDATSFGQLVPIILVGLTAFTFISILSEMCPDGRESCQTNNGYSSVTQHRKGSGRL